MFAGYCEITKSQKTLRGQMQRLKSSFIKGAEYNQKNKTLTIYIGDRSYNFMGVPPSKFKSLKAAKSKGKYFNRNLKGKFQDPKYK
jgi:hypothetical protein